MAVYQTRPWKRGDIYYVTYDNAIGSEQATGRPGIIVSSENGCATSPVLSVVYTTTREAHAEVSHNVEINATNRRSWALCNQIVTVDKIRLKNYCGTLSQAEMTAVDKAIAKCLGIPYSIVNDTSAIAAVKAELAETEAELREKDEKVFEVMAERDYYKRLYDAALGRFVDNRLDRDLANPPVAKIVPRMVPDEPEEEEPEVAEAAEVKVVEPEPLVDLNTCSAGDLKKCGMKEDMILRVIAARPFNKVEDLRGVQGITKIAWQLLQHKLTVTPVVMEDKPKKKPVTKVKQVLDVVEKVNVNTASGKEIAKALGLAECTGYTISGYRTKNGPFKSLDELKNVPRIGKKACEKALEVLTV